MFSHTPSHIFPAGIQIQYTATLCLPLIPENTRGCAAVATRRKIENQLSTTPTTRSSPIKSPLNKLASSVDAIAISEI